MRALTFNEIEIVNGATKGNTVDSYFSSLGYWGSICGVAGAFVATVCYNSIADSLTFTTLGMLVPFAGLGAGFLIGEIMGEGLYYLNKYDII